MDGFSGEIDKKIQLYMCQKSLLFHNIIDFYSFDQFKENLSFYPFSF